MDSIIPCQKEFNNNQADEKKQDTILVSEFNLVSGFSKYLVCGGCDKKLTDLQTEQKFTCKTCGAKQKVKNCKQEVTINNVEISNCKGEKFTMFTKTLARLLDLNILAEEPDKITDMLLDLENIHLTIDVISRCVTDAWIEGTATGTAPNEQNEPADIGTTRNGAVEEGNGEIESE